MEEEEDDRGVRKEVDEEEAMFAEKLSVGYPTMGGLAIRSKLQTRPPRKKTGQDRKRQPYKARRRRPAP
jgi:hypothetical protein